MEQNGLRKHLTKEITSNWYRKITGIEKLQQSNQMQQSQLSNIDSVNQPILIKKQQIIDFTKKFAMQKIQYQQKIALLEQQKQLSKAKINDLCETIQELREDNHKLQEYMVNLQEKHQKQIQNINKTFLKDNFYNQKQQLKQKIKELEQLFHQQKSQNERNQEFLQIKNQIIKNMQYQKKLKVQEGVLKPLNIKNNTQKYSSIQKAKPKNIIIKKVSKKNSDNDESFFHYGKKQIEDLINEFRKIESEKQQIQKLLKQYSSENYELKGKIQILQIDLQYIKNEVTLQKTKNSFNSNNDIQYHKTIKKLQSALHIKDQHIQNLTGEINRLKERHSNRKRSTSPIQSNTKSIKNNQNLVQVKIFRDKCEILESQVEYLQKRLIQYEEDLQFYRNKKNENRRNSFINSEYKSSKVVIHDQEKDVSQHYYTRKQHAKSIGRMLAQVSKY